MLFNRKGVVDQDVPVADAGYLQIYVESLEEQAVASTEPFLDDHRRVRLTAQSGLLTQARDQDGAGQARTNEAPCANAPR